MQNCEKTVKINKNSNAADNRQLAADKMRPISIEVSTYLQMHCGYKNSFSQPKTKHKQLAIQEQFVELCMWSESWTYPPFSKLQLEAIWL